MNKKLLLLLWCSASAYLSFAQEVERSVVATAGAHLVSNEVQWSYTIGQAVSGTSGQAENYVTQGFQQADIEIVLGFDFQPKVLMKVYPNPASEWVTLETSAFEGLQYQLMDFHGRLLNKGLLEGPATTLDVQGLKSGTYLLSVQDKQKRKLKTYTIIKK